MQNSNLFKLNGSDIAKGLVMAVLTGIAFPVVAIIQTPGFSVTSANWHQVLIVGFNGAIVGFASYLVKNFLSDEQGKVMGRIG